jgi:hypothetical protein
MSKTFKRGDHLEWNSEAGRVRGTVVKKVTFDTCQPCGSSREEAGQAACRPWFF